MKRIFFPAITLALALPVSVLAKDLEVELTNLTHGSYFTPLLVAAHNRHLDLFEVGTSASKELQAMAEGGDISALVTIVSNAGGSYIDNPAGGLTVDY